MKKALDLSRGPRIDTDQCVSNIGNRFDLVLVAAARAREMARKHKNEDAGTQVNYCVTALLDVQDKKIGREYLKKV